MRLFDLFNFKGPGLVMTEDKYDNNLYIQMLTVPVVLSILYGIDKDSDKLSCVEFFFSTNSLDKAKDLAEEMKLLKYATSQGQYINKPNQFIITGSIPKMKMRTTVLVKWVQQMCELGFKHDCRFDGWGVSIDY